MVPRNENHSQNIENFKSIFDLSQFTIITKTIEFIRKKTICIWSILRKKKIEFNFLKSQYM